tara:strand:- start:2907 stop:3110 length:204 start_codon:yes stop_codon:yes gene_type:complete
MSQRAATRLDLPALAIANVQCAIKNSNGVTQEEIRSIIHVIGIYCGVPQALECFRSARKVLEEEGLV